MKLILDYVDASIRGVRPFIVSQVLTRDIADVVGEHIAVSIGYRKKDDDDSLRPVPENVCALCGCDLRPDVASAAEEGQSGGLVPASALTTQAQQHGQRQQQQQGRGGSGAPRGAVRLEGAGGEAIYRLECTHAFHAYCIQGWALIGKKSSCPCCLERVDLRAVAGATIWAHPSIMWGQLLDAVR